MSKQIKTIVYKLDYFEDFDKAVNSALSDGWDLKKREVIVPRAQGGGFHTFIMLCAELERNADLDKKGVK